MLSSVLQCAAQLQTGLWDDSSPIAILYAIGHDKSGEPEMAIHCNTTPLCTVDIGGDAVDGSMEASAQWTLNCQNIASVRELPWQYMLRHFKWHGNAKTNWLYIYIIQYLCSFIPFHQAGLYPIKYCCELLLLLGSRLFRFCGEYHQNMHLVVIVIILCSSHPRCGHGKRKQGETDQR